MKILVDVNVFIDVLTKRANWQESLRVLNLVRNTPAIEGWVSALTIPLFYFFRLRVVDEKQARADTRAAVKGFQVVPLTQDIIEKALPPAIHGSMMRLHYKRTAQPCVSLVSHALLKTLKGYSEATDLRGMTMKSHRPWRVRRRSPLRHCLKKVPFLNR